MKLSMVLDKIENLSEGDKWDQCEWLSKTARGTCGCFAGWTLHLEYGISSLREFIDLNTDERPSEAARRILGLSSEDAHRLFKASNSMTIIKRLCNEFNTQ